jgi:hypothetical protein
MAKKILNFTISESYLKEPQFNGFGVEFVKIIYKAASEIQHVNHPIHKIPAGKKLIFLCPQ